MRIGQATLLPVLFVASFTTTLALQPPPPPEPEPAPVADRTEPPRPAVPASHAPTAVTEPADPPEPVIAPPAEPRMALADYTVDADVEIREEAYALRQAFDAED